MLVFAEYIWIDGTEPTAKLRSKTKAIDRFKGEETPTLASFPEWGFDGSSTNQAPGDSSDCALKPVFFCEDPIRGEGNFLVLCEVFNADGTPHPTNTRAKLREAVAKHTEAPECWFGFEQEYTLFRGSRPLGFPENGFPPPQGPYYCGVGADEVMGRDLVEAHMLACSKAGLKLSGVNAEVMPGQWEFQIGPATTLQGGDHLWIARWLLYRLGEGFGINASLHPKPARGDWNGAGMHTNFSTSMMRAQNPDHWLDQHVPEEGTMSAPAGAYGMDAIHAFCDRAGNHIQEHLAAYGDGYEARLTGAHETCRYDQYKYGVSDRTASIRIPMQTAAEGYGYLEDRRPNANADPYKVATVMLNTAFNLW